MQDGIADLRNVLVGQHVIVAKDDVAVGLLFPGDRADRSGGDFEVAHRTAGEQRPLPRTIPGQGMFGDSSNEADVDFVFGALADIVDQGLRMFERVPLQPHGHPDIARRCSLGKAKRDQRLSFRHLVK